jgi:hypothetical protein
VTSWPASVRRRVWTLAEATANAFTLEDLADVRQLATSLLPRIVPRKAPAKRLPGESKAAKRERRRAEHRAETARIRKAVFDRADGRCEGIVSITDAKDSWVQQCPNAPTELHHLRGGSGRRRQKQTVENCRAYCFECHRAAHRAGARETEGGEPA